MATDDSMIGIAQYPYDFCIHTIVRMHPYNGVGNGFQGILDKHKFKGHNYMKLLLALLLFATQASAESWKTKNSGQGEIVLTDNSIALSIVDTHTLFGTWVRVADYVVVKCQSGPRSVPASVTSSTRQ